MLLERKNLNSSALTPKKCLWKYTDGTTPRQIPELTYIFTDLEGLDFAN